MRFILFVHSLRSDWNHGNAHFLRGVVWELRSRGHEVEVYEPVDAWSAAHLVSEQGRLATFGMQRVYPGLESRLYRLEDLDLGRALDGADVVIAHEWSDPELIRRLGEARARMPRLRLLFHDTHHRAATRPEEMARYELHHFDGVLAFGRVIRDLYLERGWAAAAWTWHEAADTRVFQPYGGMRRAGDLVWIGNWGDGERTIELQEFLLGPARDLGLQATVYGVRYPDEARAALTAAGMRYGGWLPNYEVPRVFAQYTATLHVPRRRYVEALPGVPTIRVFEALACAIPLVCSPWDDAEHLFTPGRDYLVARNRTEMRQALLAVLHQPELARDLTIHGLATIRGRHTCAHRVDELLGILRRLGARTGPAAAPAAGRVA